jgi:plasmid stabilization system protein ParE
MDQVLWTPVAESDLDDILFYIAVVDRNAATGERIYSEIRDKVIEHVQKSLPGHRHPDAPEGWLYLMHKRWLIFYQPFSGGIEVMRVVDATRGLPRRLRDGL